MMRQHLGEPGAVQSRAELRRDHHAAAVNRQYQFGQADVEREGGQREDG